MRKGCGGIRTFSDFKFLFEALSRREPESNSLENALKRDAIRNRHHALGYCLSMIFSENRYALFRIML
ncbi:hypothetical protein ABIA06_001702 [Bradyrhizobium yuanmingense]|uniref:Uncharacterized protein n=1 Tax=Bradyrhizobium yuanmingense TaxID=108015 RepID=A0A1C3WCF4_9BRAD|nr:hypothetical protein IQ15_02656 [Bradyrhizobium yuanmingense]SCB37555.1 hypothetical protein GA0061099_1005668 [Bradyrhizobium yuanmingense]